MTPLIESLADAQGNTMISQAVGTCALHADHVAANLPSPAGVSGSVVALEVDFTAAGSGSSPLNLTIETFHADSNTNPDADSNGHKHAYRNRHADAQADCEVTFTVTTVTHAILPYDSTANHDPDGDSNGTSLVISRVTSASISWVARVEAFLRGLWPCSWARTEGEAWLRV